MKKTLFFLTILITTWTTPSLGQIAPNDEQWGYEYDWTDDDPPVDIPMSNGHNGVAHVTNCNQEGTIYRTAVEYINGIGQPIETVLVGASPLSGDIVTLQEYDAFGRQSKSWLPSVLISQGGAFHQGDAVRMASISSNAQDSSPYAYPVYEQTPLCRNIYQYGPGSDWHLNQKAVKTEHLTNIDDDEELGCLKILKALNSETIRVLGYYDTGCLQVEKVTTENGDVLLEFRDTQGRQVLSRRIMPYGEPALNTYYVYDGLSNLRYVFPPKASAQLSQGIISSSIKSQSYRYSYDGRNRLISKTLPGISVTYMAYDIANRIVFSQDGNQRARGVCTFHVYDAHGRECVMGECGNTMNTDGTASNSYARATYTGTGAFMGYDISGITLTSPHILSVKYYDSYDFLSNDSLNYVNDATFGLMHPCPRGLVTGEVSARLSDSITYDHSAYYYDEHSRIIQSHSTNHLNGYEHEYTEYDFTGNILRHKTIHTAEGKPSVTQLYHYTYDQEGRLLTTTHALNGAPVVTLVNNEYDELGRLSANNRNGVSNLRTTYCYNVRSWVSGIASGLFSEAISYNQTANNVIPRYDGNISSLSMTTLRNDTTLMTNGYQFSYDGALRLTEAQFTGVTGNDWFSTSYDYDANGNITNLIRKGPDAAGQPALWDDLTMTYSGNKLQKVTDAAPVLNTYNSMQFSDDSNTTTEYTYDSNGNMTKDSNREILSIEYNLLNLPKKITIHNGFEKMTYSINGKKLRAEKMPRTFAPSPGPLEPVGPITPLGLTPKSGGFILNTSTDYCGSVVYQNGSLHTVLVDGGYITFSNGVPAYHFYMKDHLGSNRVVASASGAVEQINMYYPFGASRKDSENKGQSQSYKYNGKELETHNQLNFYDYGARWYDPLLGRFTTIDPLCEKYYSVSPYAYCANNPVNAIDPDGRTIYILYNNNGKPDHYEFNGTIKGMIPTEQFVKDFFIAYFYNIQNGGGESMSAVANNPKIKVYLIESKKGKSNYDPEDGEQRIFWASRKGLETSEGGFQSPATILEHEFTHALDHAVDGPAYRIRRKTGASNYSNAEEKHVITGSERKTAIANGESVRKDHYGKSYDVDNPISVEHKEEEE